MKKHLLFLALSAASFFLSAAFTGVVSRIIPSPAEFIATLVAAVPLGWLAVKHSNRIKIHFLISMSFLTPAIPAQARSARRKKAADSN